MRKGSLQVGVKCPKKGPTRLNTGCVQGVPSLAVSLDNVRGKSVEEYAAASMYTVALVQVGLAISP